MSEYLFSTVKTIIPKDFSGYLITDKSGRCLLNRFYDLDHLVSKGVLAIFDILTMIDPEKEDKLTTSSKESLSTSDIIYLIEPPNHTNRMILVNLLLLQLKYFTNVRIVFTLPIEESVMKDIAMIDNASAIKSIQSMPYDPKMILNHICTISDTVPPFIKTPSYRLISKPSSLSHEAIHKPFNMSLSSRTEDITGFCSGQYNTLIISFPRSFDLFTPHMIPWFYGSMIPYYLMVEQDIIYDTAHEMIINLNTDRYYNQLKHLPYDAVSERVQVLVKELNEEAKSLKTLITGKSISRDITHQYTENNKNLASIRSHIKILELINAKIDIYKSMELTDIQYKLLMGGNISILDSLITEPYIADPSINKPLSDTLIIASLLKMKSKKFPDNYLPKPFITTSEIVKKGNIGYIGEYTLFDKLQPITFLSHISMLKLCVQLIFDIINSAYSVSSSETKLNPGFIDIRSIDTKKLSSVNTLIFHVDDYVSYEELRQVEKYAEEHKKIKIYVHSNGIK
jgi:hypothetical protein